jgi:hypothetical protein
MVEGEGSMSDGKMLALNACPLTKSGVITDKPVIVWGYLLKTDAVYDVSIEITNSDSSEVIFPTWIWSATKKGPKQIVVKGRNVNKGLRLEAETKGAFVLIPLYQNWI